MFSERSRIRFFIYLSIVLGVIISGRLFFLQVVKGDFFAEIAGSQAESEYAAFKGRGTIYDRNGKPLAVNKKVASLYVFASNLKNRRDFINRLNKAGVKLSKTTRTRLLKNEGFVWVERNVSIGLARKVKQTVPEIEYTLNENRFYPERHLAASIIGFTGVDNQGLWGLENRYDDVLKGEKINLVTLKDNKGHLILFEDNKAKTHAESALYVTIDTYLQGTAEYLLRKGVEEFNAERGIAVGIDIKTGGIVFAASSDNYDPNNYSRYSDKTWKNDVTTFLFEPGSIYKPVAFSYLLEKQGLDLQKMINCENGHFRIHGHTVSDVKPMGMATAREVLVKSSNIGMIKLTDKVDRKDFYEYMRNSGFGQKTGISGISEEDGLLRSYKQWSGLSRPSLSMGQEILVTPLQMARFYAAVANGGFLVTPSIVGKVEKNGRSESPEPQKTPIMSETTANTLRALLTDVVKEGTGQKAKSDFVEIAGKTGTGQKFDKASGAYSSREYVASFAGFYPAQNPGVAMVVVYDSPKLSIYGGSTAAITFKRLAELTSLYLGLQRKDVDESI
ncbi:penicillin-binding protein 2 [Geovibrio thiophilus]|uniref:Penicillin-binding protein 2 n=1 Tax=Geovibrio thiophilus TaxID=139438 RepID=A0A410K132_9BACT|nr:penicillin-binding protein 2 [Geovibrio thiophilus]QAR34079.1 penicillin-binding protein 2 [Geovibrio thiophilus]